MGPSAQASKVVVAVAGEDTAGRLVASITAESGIVSARFLRRPSYRSESRQVTSRRSRGLPTQAALRPPIRGNFTGSAKGSNAVHDYVRPVRNHDQSPVRRIDAAPASGS